MQDKSVAFHLQDLEKQSTRGKGRGFPNSKTQCSWKAKDKGKKKVSWLVTEVLLPVSN